MEYNETIVQEILGNINWPEPGAVELKNFKHYTDDDSYCIELLFKGTNRQYKYKLNIDVCNHPLFDIDYTMDTVIKYQDNTYVTRNKTTARVSDVLFHAFQKDAFERFEKALVPQPKELHRLKAFFEEDFLCHDFSVSTLNLHFKPNRSF